MTRTLYLVRHGERRDDVDPAWAATAERPHDPPLTDEGRRQARLTGDRLADAGIDAVFTSPYRRAVETAHHVAAPHEVPVRPETGLGEHLNADWFDGVPDRAPLADLAREFPAVDPGRESVLTPSYPETGAEMVARQGETARRLLAATEGTLALVGHGATVGGVAEHLLGDGDGIHAPYCGVTELEERGGSWRLVYSGATDHYEG